MKIEEIEEQAEKHLKNLDDCRTKELMKDTFIDGAKWGMEHQWHDLRKDPNDLPKRTGEYWICYKSTNENKKYYIETPYYTETKCWGCLNEVIAWCELPTYKEYSNATDL